MVMKKNNVLVLIALIVILGVLTLVGWFAYRPAPMMLQGQVEATEVKVASKLVGRIEQKRVRKGMDVKTGDTLIVLQSPEVEAKMQQAQAAHRAAAAQNRKAGNGAREEQVRAAKNVWLKASAAAELMEKTYNRVSNLYEEGVLPEQKRDEAETQMKAARLTEQAARSNYDMALAGTRYEDKMSAQALENQAEGAVSEVAAYMRERVLVAPIDGEIANILAEQGELVAAGFPTVSIVDLTDVWVTFQLKEELLTAMQKGTIFKASVPALGHKEIELEVTYLHPMGDFATWTATKTSGDFDMKTFEVRAVPTKPIDGLRPGMSVLLNADALNL
jgi:HlyD family secretion protein